MQSSKNTTNYDEVCVNLSYSQYNPCKVKDGK